MLNCVRNAKAIEQQRGERVLCLCVSFRNRCGIELESKESNWSRAYFNRNPKLLLVSLIA